MVSLSAALLSCGFSAVDASFFTAVFYKPILQTAFTEPFIEPYTVDLFCRVIDNYGDAGVCLRLARALVLRHKHVVRLWCDDVVLLNRLEPSPTAGLSFHDWDAHATATPAQGVICGFGCTLDDTYLQAMAACAVQPSYIHLEYLSAELWVETTHGLWSTHPRFGLKQRFCNPGFNVRTAGLLHEPTAYDEALALQTLRQYGDVPAQVQRIFVFGYPTPAFDNFIDAAQQLKQAVHWVLPQGTAGQAFYEAMQGRAERSTVNHSFTHMPFLSQTQFDAVLRSCHAAWVRGEDSAVTALFSGIPMLWQLYPQDGGAHLVKLQAYVDTVIDATSSALPSEESSSWVLAMQACNAAATLSSHEGEQAIVHFLNAVPQHIGQGRWAVHCCDHVPDLAVTLSRWLREWKIP
jgi:uncharacterized repeat protein (TIGR03837 family)